MFPDNNIEPLKIFYSYAREDSELRDELEKHLLNLKQQKVINDWYDRMISPGQKWADEIRKHLNASKIILLLVSPDFMASNYSYDVEVSLAMEKHILKEARVIPIILRPSDWENVPFHELQALPKDAKPVTLWKNRDEAFLDIVNGIRRTIKDLNEYGLQQPRTDSAKTEYRSSQTSSDSDDNTWVLALTGTVNDMNKPLVEAIIEHLRKLSGDLQLTLKRAEVGSIILVLEGTREGYEELKHKFEEGQLTRLFDIKIKGLHWGPPLPANIRFNKRNNKSTDYDDERAYIIAHPDANEKSKTISIDETSKEGIYAANMSAIFAPPLEIFSKMLLDAGIYSEVAPSELEKSEKHWANLMDYDMIYIYPKNAPKLWIEAQHALLDKAEIYREKPFIRSDRHNRQMLQNLRMNLLTPKLKQDEIRFLSTEDKPKKTS